MRTIGYIDRLEAVDPNTGELSVITAPTGVALRVRFTATGSADPEASTYGVLAVRSGGMVVFEAARDSSIGYSQTARETDSPLSTEAIAASAQASERPVPPVRPGEPRRRPPAPGGPPSEQPAQTPAPDPSLTVG